MSWDQGVCPRDELPPKFVEWADAQKGAPLQYITWFDEAEVFLDYGEAGSLKLVYPSPDQSGLTEQNRESAK